MSEDTGPKALGGTGISDTRDAITLLPWAVRHALDRRNFAVNREVTRLVSRYAHLLPSTARETILKDLDDATEKLRPDVADVWEAAREVLRRAGP